MKTSERTRTCRNKYIIYKCISIFIWLGCIGFAIGSCFGKSFAIASNSNAYIELSENFKNTLIGIGTTALICLFLCIFMSQKLRMFIWMLSVVISTICYGETAMYIIFAFWFLDEYIFHHLAMKYKNKYTINKEIDLRGNE